MNCPELQPDQWRFLSFFLFSFDCTNFGNKHSWIPGWTCPAHWLQRNNHLYQQYFKTKLWNFLPWPTVLDTILLQRWNSYLKDCGGRDGVLDSKDSKVCTFSIQNATKKDSGNYTCWAHNQLSCTEGTWSLEFRGKLRYIHIFRN